jgi:K+ transporter
MVEAVSEKAASEDVPDASAAHPPQSLRLLILGALGVVYGDIGTSPI